MVPVEPISLSIAVATLFTTCIECFEYFKAAKEFQQSSEVLLVKLEYQQERLLVWGDIAGIGGEEQHGFGSVLGYDGKRQDLTKRCLASIRGLLKNTEILKSKYGLQEYSPDHAVASPPGISSNALKRFRIRVGRHAQGPSVLEKTRWAIYDESKFQKLVEDIRDLVDGLTAELPVSSELQEQKVRDDIASMVGDVQSLHLFQEACKDDYPKWYTAASAAVDASEAATLDNCLAKERLENYSSLLEGNSRISAEAARLPTHFGDQKGQPSLPSLRS